MTGVPVMPTIGCTLLWMVLPVAGGFAAAEQALLPELRARVAIEGVHGVVGGGNVDHVVLSRIDGHTAHVQRLRPDPGVHCRGEGNAEVAVDGGRSQLRFVWLPAITQIVVLPRRVVESTG